jgi:hypothetical protein
LRNLASHQHLSLRNWDDRRRRRGDWYKKRYVSGNKSLIISIKARLGLKKMHTLS